VSLSFGSFPFDPFLHSQALPPFSSHHNLSFPLSDYLLFLLV
jgi:hypothetical protein